MNQLTRTPTGILRSRAAFTLVLLYSRLQAARLSGDFAETARLTRMIEKNHAAVRSRIQNRENQNGRDR